MKPKNAESPWKLEEAKNVSSPWSLERERSRPAPWVWRVGPRTVRGVISVILSHDVCGHLSWPPPEMHTLPLTRFSTWVPIQAARLCGSANSPHSAAGATLLPPGPCFLPLALLCFSLLPDNISVSCRLQDLSGTSYLLVSLCMGLVLPISQASFCEV